MGAVRLNKKSCRSQRVDIGRRIYISSSCFRIPVFLLYNCILCAFENKILFKLTSRYHFSDSRHSFPSPALYFTSFYSRRILCLRGKGGGVCQLQCNAELTIPVTDATAERSFSVMRRVKTYLCSTMTIERLSWLCILHALIKYLTVMQPKGQDAYFFCIKSLVREIDSDSLNNSYPYIRFRPAVSTK